MGWSHARSNFKRVSICKQLVPKIEQIRKKGPVDDKGKMEPAEPRPMRGEGGGKPPPGFGGLGGSEDRKEEKLG